MARQQASVDVRREASRRNQTLWLQGVDERRQKWLDALEKDAESWVTEDRIDELITEGE
jgi:hypothetical protein